MKRFLQKLLVFAGFVAVCFIPTWLLLGLKSFADPVGFWENMVLTGVGLYFLGFIQLVLFIVFVAVSFLVWTHKGKVF